MNSNAFLSVTCHFIDDDWCLRNFLLDFVPLSGPHYGRYLAEVFAQVMEHYGVDPTNVSNTNRL
jgi:hypothetical protein